MVLAAKRLPEEKEYYRSLQTIHSSGHSSVFCPPRPLHRVARTVSGRIALLEQFSVPEVTDEPGLCVVSRV